jgi:hypothetical protein
LLDGSGPRVVRRRFSSTTIARARRAEVLSPLGTAWQIPPGEAVISCKGESDAQAVLEIADPEGLWRPFELPCPDRVGFMSRYHMGDGDPTDPVDQARSYFAEFLKEGDIVERAGYPEAARPIVRIVREAMRSWR